MNRNEVHIGAQVTFGQYKGHSLQWTVLKTDGTKALLLCDNLVDCQPFHTEEGEIDFGSSTLRTWLNTYFVKVAFSESDAATLAGDVFLLSREEIETYLNADEDRTESGISFIPQRAALKLGDTAEADAEKEHDEYWWTSDVARFDPRFGSMITHVDHNGYYGTTPSYCERWVRPALWVNLA